MKLVDVASKSWWVPAEHSEMLAVQINGPEQYRGAVLVKLAALIKGAKDGPRTVGWLMEELRPQLDGTESPEALAQLCLETQALGEKVREGAPGMSEPASAAAAREAVEYQPELTLEDFLG